MEHAVMYGLLILEVEAMDGHGHFLRIWPEKRRCPALLIFMTSTVQWRNRTQRLEPDYLNGQM